MHHNPGEFTMKQRVPILVAVACLLALGLVHAAAPDDEAAIRATALDYIEGWYTGDAERMERCLHPDLAKRIVRHDEARQRDRVDAMGALELVQYTRAGYGTRTPKAEQQKDVEILDVFGNAASVKVTARDWVDYIHVGKVGGEWITSTWARWAGSGRSSMCCGS
jgi:hypothetical protein